MRPKITTEQGQTIMGDELLGDLIRKHIVLIPMAIDPHGKFGPMLEHFLFGYTPRKPLSFIDNRFYGAQMYSWAMGPQCPHNILNLASMCWQREKSRPFFGHSYTAPTPTEYTIGRMGLAITKAYALHLRNTNKKMGTKPTRLTTDGGDDGDSSTSTNVDAS